jgi:hypothetical protein
MTALSKRPDESFKALPGCSQPETHRGKVKRARNSLKQQFKNITRPSTPRDNGTVERFIQTSLRESA